VEPVRVPQNLELQDVIAWGLGATDLLCVVGAGVVAWWIYLVLPGAEGLRVAAATPIGAVGLACGVIRIAGAPLRTWLAVIARYMSRPRVFLTGDRA
jgi:hypothetical protein